MPSQPRLIAAIAAAALALAALPPPARACLWDSDTLQEESLGLADVKLIATGKIKTHSTYFYEQKVAYTQKLVDRGGAKAERYDDLAVALARIGKVDEAIAVLAAKEVAFPGLYTTEANLGTFLAVQGDLAGALDHLRAAIAINPDAHFGREIFQIQLLEYMRAVEADPTLPESADFLGQGVDEHDFVFVLTPKKSESTKDPDKQPRKPPEGAVEAITGMIRFGFGAGSPHLWFSLGVALAWQGHKNLAARAMWRADLLGHPRARIAGKLLAQSSRTLNKDGINGDKLWPKLGKRLTKEWATGQKWVKKQQKAEDRKLAKGKRKKVFGY